MRALIFHGYLLRGTGSNVYNAKLGPGPGKLVGDDLLCQERDAATSTGSCARDLERASCRSSGSATRRGRAA